MLKLALERVKVSGLWSVKMVKDQPFTKCRKWRLARYMASSSQSRQSILSPDHGIYGRRISGSTGREVGVPAKH